MRLLNTDSLKLREFSTDIPKYAILSHTWQAEEVRFYDIPNLQAMKHKAGYAKFERACAQAKRCGFEWIWIDACCIDFRSRAELSESLNSMYRYYRDAGVCYVYLSDVSAGYHARHPMSLFNNSRWFTRGWTLQELIAPQCVVFLDRDWNRIGTRWSLREVISVVTGIPVKVLEGEDINQYTAAQRMSWAAFRETTIEEDQVYCLMGIFGVRMPLLYGEGAARAFKRLKQEIYKTSGDHSIFSLVSVHESRGWGNTRKYTTATDQAARYTLSSGGLDYAASRPTDFTNVGPGSAYTQDVAAASQAVFSGAHHNDLKDSTITLVAGHYFSYPASAAPIVGDIDNANFQWKNYAIGGAVGSLATSGAMTLSVAKRTQIAASDLLLEQARVMSYQSVSHSLTSLYQSPHDALPTVALVLTIALRVVQLANGFLKLFRR